MSGITLDNNEGSFLLLRNCGDRHLCNITEGSSEVTYCIRKVRANRQGLHSQLVSDRRRIHCFSCEAGPFPSCHFQLCFHSQWGELISERRVILQCLSILVREEEWEREERVCVCVC